jgi:hypothetical protein
MPAPLDYERWEPQPRFRLGRVILYGVVGAVLVLVLMYVLIKALFSGTHVLG